MKICITGIPKINSFEKISGPFLSNQIYGRKVDPTRFHTTLPEDSLPSQTFLKEPLIIFTKSSIVDV